MEESKNVRNFFFIPIGEQPPRMYPVIERSSSGFTGEISFEPVHCLAFFKLISESAFCRKTHISFESVLITIVLKTFSGGIESFSAVLFAAPFFR